MVSSAYKAVPLTFHASSGHVHNIHCTNVAVAVADAVAGVVGTSVVLNRAVPFYVSQHSLHIAIWLFMV